VWTLLLLLLTLLRRWPHLRPVLLLLLLWHAGCDPVWQLLCVSQQHTPVLLVNQDYRFRARTSLLWLLLLPVWLLLLVFMLLLAHTCLSCCCCTHGWRQAIMQATLPLAQLLPWILLPCSIFSLLLLLLLLMPPSLLLLLLLLLPVLLLLLLS
jgi:hypothetical protein